MPWGSDPLVAPEGVAPTAAQAADSPTPVAGGWGKDQLIAPSGVAVPTVAPGSDTVLGTAGYIGRRALQAGAGLVENLGRSLAFMPPDLGAGASNELAPNAVARYGGAVAGAVAGNPGLAMVAPGATVGGAL